MIRATRKCEAWVAACVLAVGGSARGGPRTAEAIIDLTTVEGAAIAGATWRHSAARIVETDFRSVGPDRKPTGAPNRTYDVVPRAGTVDFDDASWEVVAPTDLDERRSTGLVCFNWYRVRVTIPDRIGDFATAGTRVEFEIVVDDYAEVWVDGRLPRELGQMGGSLIAGWNAPNRVTLTEHAVPGRQFQIAIFGINGPISDPPQNYIWMRSARIKFIQDDASGTLPPMTSIIRVDPRFDKLIAMDAVVETVADGFVWLEGPVWNPWENALYFSDIPQNAVFRWQEGQSLRKYLSPAGYTGSQPFTGREPGSNGLTFDSQGRLVLCEHGDRRIARLESDGTKTTIVDRYEGRRLNSPNDLVFDSRGNLYFTDPPFGLPGQFSDPNRELDFSGVYRLSPDGRLSLLTRELCAPNGVALSPDERTLLISNADADLPVWMAYPLDKNGIGPGVVFQNAKPWLSNGPGLPDGMKFDRAGNLFASGPGGVYVFASDGSHLGAIRTGRATSNCAFGSGGRALYLTARTSILRVRMNAPIGANRAGR